MRNDILQRAWHQYERQTGNLATDLRAVTEWAVSSGLLPLPKSDPYDILVEQMARALREEYATDAEGRRYRVNHAMRVTRSGVQTTIWAILGHAPRTHMEKAFKQRREQIVGDCVQLKTDVDVYNGMNPAATPIQLPLDFTDDVAEREFWTKGKGKKAA